MRPGFTKKDVFKRVKRAFYRLSPSRNRRETTNFLLLMNIPPLLGRRDAAYRLLTKLLSRDIFSLSDVDRCILYKQAFELINIVIDTTHEISLTNADLRNDREQYLLHYFSLLREIIQATISMVEPTIMLEADDANIQHVLGSKGATQIRHLEDTLSESEINIIQALRDFIAIAKKELMLGRDGAVKGLSPQNKNRYKRSYEAFTEQFKQHQDN